MKEEGLISAKEFFGESNVESMISCLPRKKNKEKLFDEIKIKLIMKTQHVSKKIARERLAAFEILDDFEDCR